MRENGTRHKEIARKRERRGKQSKRVRELNTKREESQIEPEKF